MSFRLFRGVSVKNIEKIRNCGPIKNMSVNLLYLILLHISRIKNNITIKVHYHVLSVPLFLMISLIDLNYRILQDSNIDVIKPMAFAACSSLESV